MSLTNEKIKEKLVGKFGDQVGNFEESFGMLSFSAPKDMNLKVLQFLYDEPDLSFRFLTDLCAVHYPDKHDAELEVVYHLHNLKDNVRLRFRVSTPVSNPDVFTATKLFESANIGAAGTHFFPRFASRSVYRASGRVGAFETSVRTARHR